MPITTDSPAPYAPATAILSIIDRYRNRGMQSPFTADVLGRAGVTDSLIPRTLQALRILDLIKEDGDPTETLELLRRAPESEFKANLEAWIRSAYADVLAFADPTDGENEIRDAFRSYKPHGQQTRMVSLFMGLCAAAGMRQEDQAKDVPPRRTARKPTTGTATVPKSKRNRPAKAGGDSGIPAELPPPLSGLLASLPIESGRWTQTERDKFMATFKVVIDFCFNINNQPTGGDDD